MTSRRKSPTRLRRREGVELGEGGHQIRVTAGGRVLEARGDAADGSRVWRVVAIESGQSLNGRVYEAAVLEAAVAMYDGVKVYNRHRTDDEFATGTTEGLVGYLTAPSWNGTGIEGDLHLFAVASGLAEALDASVGIQQAGGAPLLGLSHDALVEAVTVQVGGVATEQIRRVLQVLSVDVVGDPAAGGRALRAVAGGIEIPETNPQPDTTTEEILMDRLRELMALFTGGTISDEDRAELATLLDSELGVDLDTITVASADSDPDPAPAEELVTTSAGEARRFDTRTYEGQAIVNAALDGARLPASLRESTAARVPTRFTEADLRNLIAPAQAVAVDLEKAGLLTSSPRVGVTVTKESHDKLVERLDATLTSGVAPGRFRSYREMFRAFNPDIDQSVLESADLPYMVLREAYAGTRRMGEAGRVTESLTAASFGEILGSSITRRMIAEYKVPGLDSWRRIVSEISSISDFRTNNRVRMGGYGLLPAVNEGATYAALSSPTDEEATFAGTKRGGTEDLTMEAIANDDLGALRRIPQALGRSAAITLHRFVWNFVVTNANIYDTTALFVAGHNNIGTTALSDVTLAAGRLAMRKQAAYNNSIEVLGATPKYLVVPPELEQTAHGLTTSQNKINATEDATIPNIHQGIDAIVLDWVTDANNWYLIADPDMTPTIEVGFFRGEEEPELFVQDSGTEGAMFTADKLTYKIRHIYGGAVLDWRGFYGGIVA